MQTKANKMTPKYLVSAAFLTGFSPWAQGAGFALIEQSASGMGNAFAGAAAVAEDASTVYFNPAGMTLLTDRQLTVAAHYVMPSAKFSKDSVTTAVGTPVPTGGNGGDGGENALVPNLYYTHALNNDLRLGIGLNAPFGLATEYDADWVGRYHAIRSELQTLNINPSLAWRVNDRLSLGLGINAQRISGKLTNAVDYSSVCLATLGPTTCASLGYATPGSPATDGKATIEGDTWSWGYNLGLLYEWRKGSRLGFAYRSKVTHKLKGTASFADAPSFFVANGIFKDTTASLGIDLPESASLSAYHELNDRWSLLGDITWTAWYRFDELRVKFGSSQGDAVVTENWTRSMRYSVGTNYRLNDRWLLRGGLAYDQEPIPDAQHRTPRIPGNDRRWLALGAGYQASDSLRLDLGYAHLFVADAAIDRNDAADGGAAGHIQGSFKNKVDILSAQLSWSF